MLPKSGSKAEEVPKQKDALRSKPRSSPQPRSLQSGSNPPSRDAFKESKPFLPRKPAAAQDPLPKIAPRDPPRSSSTAPNPPTVLPAQPTIEKSADDLKPSAQPEKKGLWNWRPFRSAAASSPAVDTPQRFHVLYSLHVHSIQNIPAALNGLRLIVHWNRREEGLQTMFSRVQDGTAEFDETLRQRCSVQGTRTSNQQMKYEPKLFTISVVALDVDELELGKHHIDLSRLLPEDAGQGADSWNTSFELSGMAKGSKLIVTFNYDLLHQETSEETLESPKATGGNKPSIPFGLDPGSGKSGSSLPAGDKTYKVGMDSQNTALSMKGASRTAIEESMDRKNNPLEVRSDSQEAWNSTAEEESFPEEEQFINDLGVDLDDEVDLVAGEFLDMLDLGLSPRDSSSEGEVDSPRARLLRQFQCDGLFGDEAGFRLDSSGLRERGSSFGTTEARHPGRIHSNLGGEEVAGSFDSEDGLEMSSIMEAAELELEKATQTVRCRSRAQELEDEETQALMQRWGLNDTTAHGTSGLGNKPVFGPHLKTTPPLGKGLGSVLYLEDGGSLRSMNPSNMPKKRASGSLVMQSSKPVVVPSAMGSSAVDILRHLASLGPETLAKQSMAAMPLEDISGKLPNEVAAMASSTSLGHGNWNSKANMQSSKRGGYDDYVSLEDLAPLAMQNIEALAIDGLKVQGDVAEEEAPSYLDAAAWGILGDAKKTDKDDIQLSHDVAGMHFKGFKFEESKTLDAKEGGPLSMALTIDEWSKLDAGIVDDDPISKERSLAILAAHNANCEDWQLTSKDGKGSGKKRGNMGNTLMIAMLVQLRDPLQNFEPVGAPMLTLVQAERVMLPPKPRFTRNVSMAGNSERDDDEAETVGQKEEGPQFKLSGVHMSGLKSADEEAVSAQAQKKGFWGSLKQLQSGSRWLAAQGMKKDAKAALLKGKPAPSGAQTKVKPGETLWSISARVNGSGRKWRDLAALNPHIRNPDVIFSNETLRTRGPSNIELD